VAPDISELSSMASTIEQLSRRFTTMVDTALADGEEDLVGELQAIERALAGVERRLTRIVASSRGAAR
jgi:hypothetical protein